MPHVRETCDVCGRAVYKARFKQHILREHIPWYVNPGSACISCQRAEGCETQYAKFHSGHEQERRGNRGLFYLWFCLVNGLLLFIMQGLGIGASGNLADLLKFVVVELQDHPLDLSFSEQEYFYLREYDLLAGLAPLTKTEYECPLPSRVCVILHYRIQYLLVKRLDPNAQTKLKTYMKYEFPIGATSPPGCQMFKLAAIDSHCHLDVLANRTNLTFGQLGDLVESSIDIRYAIANFVYPGEWRHLEGRLMDDPRLKFTLGIHPHKLFGGTASAQFSTLEEMVQRHPQIVGIGEVGLDFTTRCRCYQKHNRDQCRESKLAAQHQFLRMALHLARRVEKTLVLHVRDDGDGSAAREVLTLIKELDMCSYPIHRHCFVGDEKEYAAWAEALPNCYFGLTRASLDSKCTERTLKGLQKPDRLMLETDSPYLPMGPEGNIPYCSWNIDRVAGKAAETLQCSVTTLWNISNSNAAKLYRLPW